MNLSTQRCARTHQGASCVRRLSGRLIFTSLVSRPMRAAIMTSAAASTTATPLLPLPSIPAARLPFPPHQPLEGREPGSFANGTITARLPSILAGMIRDVDTMLPPSDDKVAALAALRALREGQLANITLQPLTAPTPDAGAHPALVHAIRATNEALAAWQKREVDGTWLGLPWLLVECYMYVAIAAAINAHHRLAPKRVDPFALQKAAAWEKCVTAAAELAAEAQRVVGRVAGGRSSLALGDLKKEAYSIFMYALWGNKTDLSLLVDASAVNPVSSVDQGNSGGASHPYIIVDEFNAAWSALTSTAPGRVDIVLDNSGLELFGDLVLADFLIEAGLVTEVVMHGKPFAWFVSDVLEEDFKSTVAAAAPGSTTPAGLQDPQSWDAVRSLGSRWARHLESGKWKYTDHTFWVTPSPFCWMEAQAPDLHAHLAASKLVIFKGDLNYRKLTSDCRWPATTSFSESLLGFAPAPLLALRTLKADVVAGLKPGQAETLTKVDKDWLVNGKFGMLQFHAP